MGLVCFVIWRYFCICLFGLDRLHLLGGWCGPFLASEVFFALSEVYVCHVSETVMQVFFLKVGPLLPLLLGSQPSSLFLNCLQDYY